MRMIPSIASAPVLNIEKTLKKLTVCSSLHIDIEDGNFIPNITFGLKAVKEISQAVSLPLNVHLMVTDPWSYIRPLNECGVKEIAFHLESTPYPLEVIHQIKSMGMKAGIAYNLMTPIEMGEPFFDEADFVLIMTSEADGQGQKFCPYALKKIKQGRAALEQGKFLWVDGGIGEEELSMVQKAGADTAVIGRALVLSEDVKGRLKDLEKRCQEVL